MTLDQLVSIIYVPMSKMEYLRILISVTTHLNKTENKDLRHDINNIFTQQIR